MNSTGLLVLNDMDNIVAAIFMLQYDPTEHDESLKMEDKIQHRDKLFAKFLTFPYLLFTAIYTIWFLGVFQPDDPSVGFLTLILWNPYSIIFFPIICFSLYIFFYKKKCKKLRNKFFKEEELIEDSDNATLSGDDENDENDETEAKKDDNEAMVQVINSSTKKDIELVRRNPKD